MIVLLHVVFSLISLVVATYGLFNPSRRQLQVVYGLTSGAIISGVGLGIMMQVNLVQACISGSLYLGFIVISSLLTRHRLASAKS